MVPLKFTSLVKPTIDTTFRIDFEWWKNHDRDWRIYLKSLLCEEHQQIFNDFSADQQIDWIDPDTAQVTSVDALQHVLISHCAKQESFMKSTSSLVDSVFRIFMANGNQPLNSKELSEILNKPPQLILRTFGSSSVYKGIRPVS